MSKNQKIYRKCHNKCERCRNERDLLVHHMDRNRSNNEFSNLEVLCSSCHAIEHERIRNFDKMRYLLAESPLQLTFNFK